MSLSNEGHLDPVTQELGDRLPNKSNRHHRNFQSRARYQSQKKQNEGRPRTPHNNHNNN